MNRPLSILHTEASQGWGGQELRILTEARGLIARGHRVEIATGADTPLLRAAPDYGVPVHPLALSRKRPAVLMGLRRLMREGGFDVVNTHSHTDSLLAALACSLTREAPALVRSRHISAPVSRSPLNRWIYGRLAQAVVTTGESIREHVIAQTGAQPTRVLSVPTGIDGERFAPGDAGAVRAALGLPADAFLVGIVATLRSWKGHRFLLEALAALPDPRLRVVVVGDGPQRHALEAMAVGPGLAGRVAFAGNRDDVPDWLRAFDVFCLPSTGNEGVPQGLVQAMMTGLPCVTTPAGSIAELVAHERTGLLVPMEDAPALAAAIDRLFRDAALRDRLGTAARAHALAHHGLDRMLDTMTRVFLAARERRAP